LKGCFVGITGMDFVFYQKGNPKENRKSKTNKYTNLVGGPAANAAITYSLLGGKAFLVTAIGDSPMGLIMKDDLVNKYNIELFDVIKGKLSLPFISAVSINMLNGDRTIWSGQNLAEYSTNNFTFEDFTDVNFCLSDCNLFEISLKVLKTARQSKVPIVLDAGSWKNEMEFYLKHADFAIASSQCETPGYKDFFDAGKYCNVKNIAVTDGKDKIKWVSENFHGDINPPIVESKDTLAAGDIFHGAFCFYKFDKNLSFEKSLEMASIVASESVKYEGPFTWAENLSKEILWKKYLQIL